MKASFFRGSSRGRAGALGLVVLAGAALSQVSLEPSTPEGASAPRGGAAAPAAAAQKDAGAPRAEAAETRELASRPRFERVPPGGGAPERGGGVYREVPAEEALEALLEQATVTLSPEEEALLREAGGDGLAGLVTRTERELLQASDADRPEKQRRYTMALNLLPKLEAEEEPEPQPALRAQQERYLRAAAREQRAWAKLDEADRASQRDAFKQRFFKELIKE